MYLYVNVCCHCLVCHPPDLFNSSQRRSLSVGLRVYRDSSHRCLPHLIFRLVHYPFLFFFLSRHVCLHLLESLCHFVIHWSRPLMTNRSRILKRKMRAVLLRLSEDRAESKLTYTDNVRSVNGSLLTTSFAMCPVCLQAPFLSARAGHVLIDVKACGLSPLNTKVLWMCLSVPLALKF